MNKRIVALIISTAIIQLTWSLVVLPLEFPDEQAHLATVEFLSTNYRMPKGDEYDLSEELLKTEEYLGTYRDVLGNNKYTYHKEYHPPYSDGLTGIYENAILDLRSTSSPSTYISREAARYPLLYYFYSTIIHKFMSSADIITRLFSLRIGSIILSTALVYFAYLIGREIFTKNHSLSFILVTMVSLHPMVTFVGAGVNSDNLFNLFFTMLIYYLIKVINIGWNKQNTISVGIIMGLALLTKTQAYLMIPIMILASLIRLKQDRSIKQHFHSFGIVFVIAILLAGWQELPKIFSLISLGIMPGTELVSSVTANPPEFGQFARFSLNKLYAQNIVWYWGVFKWLGVVLPAIYWQITNRIVALSAIGIVLLYIRKFRSKQIHTLRLVTFLAISILIYILGIFLYDYKFASIVGYTLGIQARYYYPMIVGQMSLVLIGITSLTTNHKISKLFGIIIGVVFVWLQLGGIYTILDSYYDLSSISIFITQISQYKPFIAKGNWWYLWAGLYFWAIITQFRLLLTTRKNLDSKG